MENLVKRLTLTRETVTDVVPPPLLCDRRESTCYYEGRIRILPQGEFMLQCMCM